MRKGTYNIIYGILNLLITALLGLIIPRLFLVNFGSEVNGLTSSIIQIFAYVGILEAGVGATTRQALYQPIARNDKKATNAILSATNKYYRKTGYLYLAVVILLTFLYPLVVKSTIDSTIVRAVILMVGLGEVINFFFQNKYNVLLQAEGKNYVITNLNTFIYVLTSISRIILLQLGYNVVIVQSAFLVFNLVQSLFIIMYIKRFYSWIDLTVKPDYDAISQKNSVLIHQISGLIFNNTDILVLTVFTNLRVVSVYTLYNIIFTMANRLTNQISEGITFALGQSYGSNIKKFKKLFDVYELYYITFVFSVGSILKLVTIPFMNIYTAGITDIDYTNDTIANLFIIQMLLLSARSPSRQAIDVAGHFKNTKWRSIFESIINLTFSLILVNYIGIYGVLIGTIVALLYRTNDMILYSNKKITLVSSWITYRRWFVNFAIFGMFNILFNYLSIEMDSIVSIMIVGVVSVLIVMPTYFIINSLLERKTFLSLLDVLAPYIKRKLK